MNTSFLPGIIRGLGRARIKFDLAYRHKKIEKDNLKKFSFLEKLNLKEREFSKSSIFKTFKFFSEPNPDEVLFWTFLKLIHAEESGGICVPKKDIIEFINKKNPELNVENSWNNYFSSTREKTLLCEDGEMIYLNHLYKTEIRVCNLLTPFFQNEFSDKFLTFKSKTLSEEQNKIVNSIFQKSISFLFGGPGTGKTTIIQAIVKSSIQNGISPSDISLLAPTGKAAKRLQESCSSILKEFPDLDLPSTIHRFLGYNPTTGKCNFNMENPTSKKLLIIDESSMLDIFILKAILDAYPNDLNNKRLIFVGDPDQLLSVNSGSVFADFVKLNLNTFQLTQSFRQSVEGEEIKSIASQIKRITEGEQVDSILNNLSIQKEISANTSGVCFVAVEKDQTSLEMVLHWYKSRSEKKLSAQILTPYNETQIGVKSINGFIQQNLRDFLEVNKGFPAIVNSNLYDLELFNGENGYLTQTATGYKFNQPSGKEVEISNSYLEYFDPAFAITVHKSQGSEYDHICLVIPAELENPDSLLNIRILYTAITRAKKSVTILGSEALFAKALKNQGEKRYSKIVERLKQSFNSLPTN